MDVTDLVIRLDDRANQPASDVTEVLAPLPEGEQPDQEDPVREAPIEAPGGWSALHVQLLDHEADVVAGWKNKLQSAVANVTPNETLAEQHRKMAEPGTARTRAAGRD